MSQQLVTRETGPLALTTEERGYLHEALDKLIDVGIGGSTHDPNVAAAFLEWASKKAILLSPVMGAFRLQPGWELAFTKLKVDTSKEAKLVYSVSNFDDDDSGYSSQWGPKTPLAFHKPLLNIIRTHLGIEPKDMVRIGDVDPLCHEYKMYGEVMGVDGRKHQLFEQGGLDLRDGSPATLKVLSEARGKNPEEKARKGEANLMRMRAKILQRATTNVEERLIISYGFRSSYTKEELDSKFIVCVRPIETGYHPDPEMQKILLQDLLYRRRMAESALFGAPPEPPPTFLLPPTINASPASTADIRTEASTGETDAGQDEGAGEVSATTEGQSTQTAATVATETAKTPAAYVLKTGRGAGKSVPALTNSALSMYVGLYDELSGDEAQMADIKLDRNALLAEVDARKAESNAVTVPEQSELKL